MAGLAFEGFTLLQVTAAPGPRQKQILSMGTQLVVATL